MPQKTCSILIIDDNASNVLLLEKFLKINGYTNLRTSIDPRNTVRLCEQQTPDLLLLDLRMPYLDGFEVIGKLHTAGMNTFPIIMVSAENDKDYFEKALAYGVRDFITKPFNFPDILQKIISCLSI